MSAPAELTARRASAYLALVLVTLTLLVAGVVFVVSASAVVGLDHAGEPLLYVNRHLVAVALAVVTLLVTLHVDYHLWRRWSPFALGIVLVLLAMVLVTGEPVGGAKRWLELGPLNLQPSELAKLALTFTVAMLLDGRDVTLAVGVRRTLLLTGATAALVLAQPDLGTAVVLVAIVVGLLFAAGVPGRLFVALGAMAVPLGAVAVVAADYRRARLVGFLNPVEERLGAGYQTYQSLIGLAEGGAGGTGIGAGQAKWGWVPNAHTDFIFVIVGEETGLVGGLVVLGLLGFIGVIGFRIAARASDTFGRLVAAGITTWLMAQSFINVGGVVGLLPVTGIPLPFMSFGASSLVATAAAAGVLANIARAASATAPSGTRRDTQSQPSARRPAGRRASSAHKPVAVGLFE